MRAEDLPASEIAGSWWDEKKLQAATIMVAGAGALGNEVLKNLALSGAGKIFLVDFDVIEYSNLSRAVLFRENDTGKRKVEAAAKRLKAINPQVKVRPFHGDIRHDLGLGVYRRMNMVIGCLDNGEARLKVNRDCWKTNVPWIDGGLLELAGTVKVFKPPGSACYECGMSRLDYQLINLHYSCDLLAQNRVVEGAMPTTPTMAAIIGAIQTLEAVKLLHGIHSLAGKGVVYNGRSHECFVVEYPRKQQCLSHEAFENIIELEVGAETVTAREMLKMVRQYVGAEAIIELGFEIIQQLVCPKCGSTERIMKPVHQITAKQSSCLQCGGERIPEMTHKITGHEDFGDMTLAALGIPFLDILTASHNGRHAYFELTHDVHHVMRFQ